MLYYRQLVDSHTRVLNFRGCQAAVRAWLQRERVPCSVAGSTSWL